MGVAVLRRETVPAVVLAALVLAAVIGVTGDWQHGRAESGREVAAITVGGNHVCVLLDSGEVVCWGADYDGQIDAPSGSYRAISAGDYHSCGLLESGEAVCWGGNEYGQTDAPAGRFTAISSGYLHS